MTPVRTWQSIIAGVDGSPESLDAAALAWRIAERAKVRLILVRALPNVGTPGVGPVIPSPDLMDRLITELRQSLRESAARIGMPQSVIDACVVQAGRPAEVLADAARAYEASLIVVGGRRRGVLARRFGGSTAHQLARTADYPLLVATAADAPRRILAAIDLSSASDPTLSLADRFAKLLGSELRVMHVVEPVRYTGPVPLAVDMTEFTTRSEREFQRVVDAQVPAIPKDERVIRQGPADEAIAEEAAAWNADLIVVGTHGKAWIERVLIGSTTERLLNRLPASLLIVPVPKPSG